MTLYFAYGSNMSRDLMRRHCPTAPAIGTAVLDDHQFVITTDGYASVVPRARSCVEGVLWRLTPRDVAALNIYESVDSGLYRSRRLVVRCDGARHNALIYIARPCASGKPKSGYLELVIAAARDWGLSEPYMSELARWVPSAQRGVRQGESGEIG
jgi:hypothetical protein